MVRLVLVGWCFAAVTGCRLVQDDIDVIEADGRRNRELAVDLNRRGCRALANGRLPKAESLLQRAVLADETYGLAHNNLGLVYFENGDLYSAAWSFQRAIDMMPERPEPFNNLGMVLEAAGRLDEAINQYLQAHELESGHPEYLGNLVRARLRRGDLDPLLEQQLQQLVLVETRPEWRDWAEDQLALFLPKAMRRLSAEDEPEEIDIGPAGGSNVSPSNPAAPDKTPESRLPAPVPTVPELVPPSLNQPDTDVDASRSVLERVPRRRVGD